MPTELVDAGNPLAVAFHASACLDDIPDVTVLGRYWGAGRRKALEARDALIRHGLWISVRRDWNVPAEIRTAETRVTLRDLVELALECPAGSRIETAGCTWDVSDSGSPVLVSGDPSWPGLTGLPAGSTETGKSGGHDGYTETGKAPRRGSTETGKSGGHDGYTETGRAPRRGSTETGKSGGHDGYTETGKSSRARFNEVNSFLPEGRKEGINEGDGVAPPSGAGDAAPEDDELTAEVRDMVRRLPWSKAPVGRTAGVLADANARLVPAIVTAIREHGLILDGAQEHVLARLPQAKSVGYLVGAFAPERLTLPDPTDVLDLPTSTPHEAAQQQQAQQTESDGEPELPPWCGECGDGGGDPEIYPTLRRFYDETAGRTVPCVCSRPGWQHNSAA